MTGEPLGTIGQPKPPPSSTTATTSATAAELPEWKKEFLQRPSISVRKGIAWVSHLEWLSLLLHVRLEMVMEMVG